MVSKTVLGLLVLAAFIIGQGCTTSYNQTTLEKDRAESNKAEVKDKTQDTVQEEGKNLYP
jgi:hypothetical protein